MAESIILDISCLYYELPANIFFNTQIPIPTKYIKKDVIDALNSIIYKSQEVKLYYDFINELSPQKNKVSNVIDLKFKSDGTIPFAVKVDNIEKIYIFPSCMLASKMIKYLKKETNTKHLTINNEEIDETVTLKEILSVRTLNQLISVSINTTNNKINKIEDKLDKIDNRIEDKIDNKKHTQLINVKNNSSLHSHSVQNNTQNNEEIDASNFRTSAIYLIQTREFLNTSVFKIGKTRDELSKRLGGYGKGGKVICTLPFDDSKLDRIELELVQKLSSQFIHRTDIGKEYIEGNYKDIMKILMIVSMIEM